MIMDSFTETYGNGKEKLSIKCEGDEYDPVHVTYVDEKGFVRLMYRVEEEYARIGNGKCVSLDTALQMVANTTKSKYILAQVRKLLEGRGVYDH